MKLKRLNLANYRGFEQLDIAFEDDITVIAGVNGVGKTGILKAIASSASYALPKFTPSNEKQLSLSETDIYYRKPGTTLAAQLQLSDGTVHVDITRSSPISEDKVAELNKRRDELRFAFRETSKDSKEASEIDEEIRRISLLLENPEDTPTVSVIPINPEISSDNYFSQARKASNQPIIVLYSTNRFLTRLPVVLPKTKRIDIAMAYSKALNQLEVSLNDFANWYRVLIENASKRGAFTKKILAQLDNAINVFLPEMGDLKLHTDIPPKFSVRKNESRLYLDQLSDGERGLLALVFDLIRRLAIANPESDNPISEGEAVVMIDEVELHLHPKWQREVLGRLNSVFVNSQFIVTTHSPMVLGETEARCIRFLYIENKKVKYMVPNEALGLDANRVLSELMGTPVRNRSIEQKLNKLFELIDKEKFDEARTTIAALKTQLGEYEPELTRASSLLKFLEGAE